MYTKMDRYSLISTKLPFEIQLKIILKAEQIWIYENVNKIIDNWYRYMSRKISLIQISNSFNKYKINNQYYIDPLDQINIKKIKYINKYFTGKIEDIVYWTHLLQKLCQVLILNRSEIYRKNTNYIQMEDAVFNLYRKIDNIQNNPIINQWLNIYYHYDV
jgi:hypothetical protein